MSKQVELVESVLVVHKVKLHGGISYKHEDREENVDENQRETTTYQGVKTVNNVVERNEGMKLRNQLVNSMRKLCAKTPIGLVCPKHKLCDIDEEDAKQAQIIADFNDRAKHSWIDYCTVTFNITSKDERALRAISESIVDSLKLLELALSETDPAKIREIIKTMEGFEKIVKGNASDALAELYVSTKAQARRIAKVLKKTNGDVEKAREVIDLSQINLVRFKLCEFDNDESFGEAPSVATSKAAEL